MLLVGCQINGSRKIRQITDLECNYDTNHPIQKEESGVTRYAPEQNYSWRNEVYEKNSRESKQ